MNVAGVDDDLATLSHDALERELPDAPVADVEYE
jgi:hypothetical protein